MSPCFGPRTPRRHRRVGLATLLTLLLAFGGAAGAGVTASAEPTKAPTATSGQNTDAPDETTSADPEPTGSTPVTPSPTPTPPSVSPTQPTPTISPTSTASASPTLSPSPSPSASPSTPAATTAPRPPAVAEAENDPTSWIIALVVLLVSSVAVVLLVRRTDTATVWPTGEPPTLIAPVAEAAGTAARLASLEAVGEAMLDAGYSVTGVQLTLEDIAAVNGYPDTDIIVLPNALFVSARGVGEVNTGAVSSGKRALMLNQVDALDDVVHHARNVPEDAAVTVAAVAAARVLPLPYSVVQRVIAHALLSGSLAVLLEASWTGIPVAMALGALVGAAQLLTAEVSHTQQALITVTAAFVVSVTVFGLTRVGMDAGVLPALIAPLVSMLPGGLLTTGVIELATGQMMSGAGRVAGGFTQLVLLATGVVSGATLLGIPAISLDGVDNPIGPLAPWLSVAVFGVAMVIYRGGRLASIPWVLLVLYVAYGAQVIGAVFFGGVLSAMIGAFAMTPIAYLVSTRPSGPAAFTSFLPAFWMLVPGALGLVGVASIMGGDSAGLNTLATTAGTMVAITLGILAGSVIGSRVAGPGTVVAV